MRALTDLGRQTIENWICAFSRAIADPPHWLGVTCGL